MADPKPDANGNWFVNKNSGEIKHITNFFEKMYYEAQGGTWESFGTQADAQAFSDAVKAHKTDPSKNPSPVKDWWLNTQDGTITHDPGADLKSPWMAFATEADAKAYLKAHPANILSDVPGGNVISDVTGAVAKISGLALDLEDGNMWVSMGWITLGLLLTGVGFYLLFKEPINQAVGGAAKVAALL